jgi:hypothetical protein
MTTLETVKQLNQELFLKNRYNLVVDVSVTNDQNIDLIDLDTAKIINTFEDCQEAISAISSFILPRI